MNKTIKKQVENQIKNLSDLADEKPFEARDNFVTGLKMIAKFSDGLSDKHSKKSEDYIEEVESLDLKKDEDIEKMKDLMHRYVENYLSGGE